MKTASKTICALLFNMLMGAIIATLLGVPLSSVCSSWWP